MGEVIQLPSKIQPEPMAERWKVAGHAAAALDRGAVNLVRNERTGELRVAYITEHGIWPLARVAEQDQAQIIADLIGDALACYELDAHIHATEGTGNGK